MDLWNDSQLYRLGFDGMGRVWCGVVMQVFFGDNSFSHYKIRTHDVGKLRFSRVYMVSTEWEAMTLYVAATQQVNSL